MACMQFDASNAELSALREEIRKLKNRLKYSKPIARISPQIRAVQVQQEVPVQPQPQPQRVRELTTTTIPQETLLQMLEVTAAELFPEHSTDDDVFEPVRQIPIARISPRIREVQGREVAAEPTREAPEVRQILVDLTTDEDVVFASQEQQSINRHDEAAQQIEVRVVSEVEENGVDLNIPEIQINVISEEGDAPPIEIDIISEDDEVSENEDDDMVDPSVPIIEIDMVTEVDID